jgi:branched-chain amino acid transport system ATP-binding protein
MLEIKGLHSGYGKSEVIRGISLKVEEGEIVTIIGPNGAGKTTLFQTIFGFLAAREGMILFEGDDLVKKSPQERIQRGITMVPQGRNVFPYLTVLDNLEVGGYTVKSRKELEERVQKAYRMFPILKARTNQNAGTLSGGEQQMLVIARALMVQPKFLMLDEPSLGIAPLIVKEIFKNIEHINREQDTTILVVEQNANVALKVAHRGYVMEGGEILMSGSAEEFLNDDRVKKAYLGKRD